MNTTALYVDALPTFKPDLVLNLPDLGRGSITVHLVEGGEIFPWAEYDDKIYTGPPEEDAILEDGTPMDQLEWTASTHWVLAAFDAEGKEIVLTAREHRSAMDVVGILAESPDLGLELIGKVT